LTPLSENPNAPDPDGFTPIQTAAKHGHFEVINILIPFSENPNAPDPYGFTPIQTASSFGYSEVVRILAPLCKNPNAPDEDGRTPSSVTYNAEIFAILNLALGRPEEAAKFLHDTAGHNVLGPFRIWSEMPDGRGCQNFLTAAGAYLQILWAGYGGLRLRDDSLSFHNPRPLGNTTALRLRALAYRGSLIDVHISEQWISLQLSPYSPPEAVTLQATWSQGEAPVENSSGQVRKEWLSRATPVQFSCKGTVSLKEVPRILPQLAQGTAEPALKMVRVPGPR